MAESYFGEGVAERYDEAHAEMIDSGVVGPAVDFLANLARRRCRALAFS